ncbi:MAG: phosphoribosylformylglycinamidine synthase subunit PurQ [Acidobacteriota bacterium]
MRFGVVVFPGSNCDHDTYHCLKNVLGYDTVLLWHQDPRLRGVEVVVVPGGFSYGDYLRCGAIARFSPIMESIGRHAAAGNLVLGICNGFQILQEAGLLEGVMLRNKGLKFLCRQVHLRVENTHTPFTSRLLEGQVLRMPIAHMEGNFFAPPDQLRGLVENRQIVLSYAESDGSVTPRANPNGSLQGIAGIVNSTGNVMGLMPHPERASEQCLGSADGRGIFESIVHSLSGVRR